MRAMPTITLKRTPSDHIIASDEQGYARVLETREELDEYIDEFCAGLKHRNEPTDYVKMLGIDPVAEIDEIINSLHQ